MPAATTRSDVSTNIRTDAGRKRGRAMTANKMAHLLLCCWCGSVAFWCTLLAFLPVVESSSSSSSSSSTASSSSTSSTFNEEMIERLGLQGIKPDPFVLASPLIVAAVCADGVAMVASHTVSVNEQLLREVEAYNNSTSASNKQQDDNAKNDKDSTNSDMIITTRWRDLPADQHHGGPFRINKIDRFGTHLMAAGWRADCDMLAERCRAISSREVTKFGTPKWGLPYGRFLAMEASFWMAQRAVSDGPRALSCAGLLASCGDEGNSIAASLWLIEATGAYRVRALAIGGGKVEGGGQDEKDMVADIVNQQLQLTDFGVLTAKEGAKRILEIIVNENRQSSQRDKNPENEGERTTDAPPTARPLIPADCELEIAITNSERRQMRRLRLSSLFPAQHEKS